MEITIFIAISKMEIIGSKPNLNIQDFNNDVKEITY